MRYFFLCAALFLSMISAAYTAMISTGNVGGYQKTKDGKTLVWNNHPDRGDEATWSGDRDERGYATGPGTLTWYRAAPKIVTGSNIPAPKGPVKFLSRLSGTMAAGKFEGLVEMVNAAGRTYHTVFTGGNSNDDWEIGPAPTPGKKSKAHARETAIAKAPEGSSPSQVAEPSVKSKTAAAAAVTPTPEPQSSAIGLFKPPSSLRETEASPTPPIETSPAATVPVATPDQAAMPAPTDEEAVRDLVRAFSEGWENHDGHEMDKIMADDVDFITADGVSLHGRAELEKYHARQSREHFKDPKGTSAQAKVRFLKPDVAQLTWNWTMRGELNPDGTVRPRRTGVMTMTAEKRNGTWLIVAAKNANAGANLPEAPVKKP
jgi:uncharacterized protein (TIGR02246 family)